MYVPNKDPGPHFFLIPLNKYKGKIPFIVTDILKQLQNLNSQENEGIFRIPGKQNDITNLCKELDNGRINDWSRYESKVIESAFKKYLENISIFDPLIPDEIENEVESAVTKIPEDQIGQYFHDIFSNKYSNLLTHRTTLATILNFFSKVIQPNVEKNRMNPENIATCLFMLFFRRRDEINLKLLKPFQIFIEKFDQIFEESWYSPEQNYLMSDTEIECLGAPFISIELAQIEYQRRNNRKNSLIPYYVHETIEPPKREAPKLPES